MNDRRQRLFVALDLPDRALDAMEAWRASALGTRGGLRHMPRDSLHVTLAFLGVRSEADAGAAAAATLAAAAPVGGLALGEPLWLPARSPRLLALAIADRSGALGALQTRLVTLLTQAVGFEAEKRPYLPHVTLARVPSGGHAPRDRELDSPEEVAFEGAAVTLYESVLRPSGARYTALTRADLL